MSDYPSLAEVMARHADWVSGGARLCSCFWTDDSPEAQESRLNWAKHVESEWREACTIRTVEQLDALPDHSTILVIEGGEINRRTSRSDGSAEWWTPGSDEDVRDAAEMALDGIDR